MLQLRFLLYWNVFICTCISVYVYMRPGADAGHPPSAHAANKSPQKTACRLLVPHTTTQPLTGEGAGTTAPPTVPNGRPTAALPAPTAAARAAPRGSRAAWVARAAARQRTPGAGAAPAERLRARLGLAPPSAPQACSPRPAFVRNKNATRVKRAKPGGTVGYFVLPKCEIPIKLKQLVALKLCCAVKPELVPFSTHRKLQSEIFAVPAGLQKLRVPSQTARLSLPYQLDT